MFPFKDIMVDITYLDILSTHRYNVGRVELSGKVPFVRLPVVGVFDSVHRPQNTSEYEDQPDEGMASEGGDLGTKYCRQVMVALMS